MKCKSCGANIQLEDVRCPYCNYENTQAKRHWLFMHRYQKDYEATKDEVYKKTNFFTSMAVRSIFIAVLILLNVAVHVLYGEAWKIASSIEEVKINREYDIHYQALRQYETDENYIGFTIYYEGKSLYSSDLFSEFSRVSFMCNSFMGMYRVLLENEEDSHYTLEEKAELIEDNVKWIYRYSEPTEYSNQDWFKEEHAAFMDAMIRDMKYLLVTYAGVDSETIKNFDSLTDGRRKLAIERGLGLDAEE